MGNREKIIEVLRRSPLAPVTYTDLKMNSGVPAGSFDRTLAALVRDGTVLKVRDGLAIETEETRAESGGCVYCARCEGSHPSPDKGSGETFEDVHRRAIAP